MSGIFSWIGRGPPAPAARGVEIVSHSLRSRHQIVLVVVLMFATMALTLPASARPVPGTSTLAFVQQPTASSAGELIAPAVTVVAKNAKGQVSAKFKGAVTLTLVGAGTLYGTVTKNAVQGVATFTDLVVDPAGTYALVASAVGFASATSANFSITGFAIDCGGGPCSLSTGNIENPTPEDTVIGVVSVSTDACGSDTCFLTVDETPGDFCPGGCIANAVKFITPSNATGIVEVQYGCDKSLCPGTGVSNFTLFLEKENLEVVELFDCPNPAPGVEDLPCIQKRSRTGVGDLLFFIWLTPTGDPRVST